MTNSQPKLWIHGATGKMGEAIQKELAIPDPCFMLAGGSAKTFAGTALHQGEQVTPAKLAKAMQPCQLVFDFSTPLGNELLLESFHEPSLTDKSLLIGTTNLTTAMRKKWQDRAKSQRLKLLFAPNTSLGVLLLAKAVSTIYSVLGTHGFDVEIVESHHRFKADAPSGTAKMIAQELIKLEPSLSTTNHHDDGRKPNSLGMHAIRGGQVFGEHEICFLGDFEELRISHRALDRRLFAKGAITLGQWLLKQKPGVYEVSDIDPSELAT